MLVSLAFAAACCTSPTYSPTEAAEPVAVVTKTSPTNNPPRVVVYVDAAFTGCTECRAAESEGPQGTGSIKDLVLECCAGGTAGQIATSGYTLSPGECQLQEATCNGTKNCSLAVTLTIQMGCHSELWVIRPGMDPDDDGRITQSIAIPIFISAICENTPGGKKNDSVDVVVSRVNCSQPGQKGDKVGQYHPVLTCSQCR